MYWPDTQTGVDTEPARKPVASAVRKFFTEGGLGQPPTVPGGDWFNQITNEMLNVLAAAGIDPSKTDDDQLLQAIDERIISNTAKITGRYAYSGKSIYDILDESERSRLFSDDETLDLTAKIQSLIDEQKPFYLIPNIRHYCYGMLHMKSGAKILGAGDGTNQKSGNAWTVETAIVFNQATTNIGIQLSSASGWVTEWAIDGVTIDTIDNVSALTDFKALNVSSEHDGCYSFKLHCYIRGARHGAYIDAAFWNGDIDLRLSYCYLPFFRSPNGASTSLSGWVKCSFCFHGVDLTNVVYSPLSFWFDKCGLLSAPASSAPADELPILLKANACVAMNGVIGVEESKAQFINAQGYSSLSYSCHYFTGPTYSFYKDPARTANVPLVQQGVVLSWNSSVVLRDFQFSRGLAGGFPAASTTDPTYFFLPFGSDNPVVDCHGCFMDSVDYCAHPSGTEQYVNLRNDKNRFIRFAATNISKPRVSLDYRTDLLMLGSDTVRGGHQIKVRRAFLEGDMALEVGGATGAANVIFNAVNGSSGSTANAAMRIPAAVSTSRSVNAGGTINASGADYAEYLTKVEGCGVIAKGSICGVNSYGELTDRYDDSISFVVKSTSPAYVGGDSWFDDVPPSVPEPGAGEDEIERYDSCVRSYSERMEVARQRVDRIAFCGQVPVNLFTAFNVGDYILPLRKNDGSIGAIAVQNPDFYQYTLSIGRVCRTGDDGRPVVFVKIV